MVNLQVRADLPVATLSFFAFVENEMLEVARIQVARPHLKRIGELFIHAVGDDDLPDAGRGETKE